GLTMRAWPLGCQRYQQPEEDTGGDLGGRGTLDDIASVNTVHHRTTFQPFPVHHHFFPVCAGCRNTITLAVVFDTGHLHDRSVLGRSLPMALLWRGVAMLRCHRLRRRLDLSLRLLSLRWGLLGLGHGQR